jgi:hypothetical protein
MVILICGFYRKDSMRQMLSESSIMSSHNRSSARLQMPRFLSGMAPRRKSVQGKGLQNGLGNFSGCNLTTIPKEVFNWISRDLIRVLDISNNNLQLLPTELSLVKKVIFNNNPLLGYPLELRTSRWSKMKAHLTTVVSRANFWNVRKVILVGEEGVGKSVYSGFFIPF